VDGKIEAENFVESFAALLGTAPQPRITGLLKVWNNNQVSGSFFSNKYFFRKAYQHYVNLWPQEN
jgi:hypothetical protein